MPKTKLQNVIFTIIMAVIMVYGMIVYNVALNTGGVTNQTFLLALHELPIMAPIAFILEFFVTKKFCRFSDYLGTTSQMSELLGISSISGILRFGRYPAYHGISEPHLALKSSKTVVETAAYYYAASLSIAAFAEV
ncbi:hypothetical protein [Flavonifractor sp. An52]|uniref:hypothetical protein n=1 Tax=Flavonifractor sp. An52 TaxID=1965642 RepID=UPI001FA8A222|nr:hypothetical protein [Flavonifractor sp. An52]